MSDWYEEMEQAEQEYDAKLEDEARAYQQGRADAIEEINNREKNIPYSDFARGFKSGYEKGQMIIAEHDAKIMSDAIDEFVNWAYIHGVSFSFMGKIKEDGTSDVVDRLNAIKSDFYKQMKEQSNEQRGNEEDSQDNGGELSDI